MCAAELTWQEFETGLHRELAACSSRFHRLLLIATYWNNKARLFVNPATGEVLPQPISEKIAALHARTFEEWLCMPLAEQFRELLAFLHTLRSSDRQTFVFLLRCPDARVALVPHSANSREVQLFSADLNALITMDQIPDSDSVPS
jgi:hypothetical protein